MDGLVLQTALFIYLFFLECGWLPILRGERVKRLLVGHLATEVDSMSANFIYVP